MREPDPAGGLRLAIERTAIRGAHALRTVYWRVFRPRTRGVQVAVREAGTGAVLLVRHTYGSRARMFPGGGLRRGESPEAAAAREVSEETGLTVTGLRLFGRYDCSAEGKRDGIHFFVGEASGVPRPDLREIAEAAFHPADPPPADASPATRRRLDEIAGRREVTGGW